MATHITPVTENPTISKVTLPSGNTYDIKDAAARGRIDDSEEELEQLQKQVNGLQNYTASGVEYIGTTTTALSDGATTATVDVDGKSITPVVGAMVNYDNVMFAWNGTQWDQLGTSGPYGALAYKESVTGNVTPTGKISEQTVTADPINVNADYTPEGTVTVTPTTKSVKDIPFNTMIERIKAEDKEGTTTTLAEAKEKNTNPYMYYIKGIGSDGSLMVDFVEVPDTDISVVTGIESAEFTGTAGKATQTVTPTAKVSQATFTGDETTVTSK